MMKKKALKTGLIFSLLMSLLSLTLSACAEENGYWTMKTDESGIPVMIFTYTGPVEWVVDENAGYGHCDMQSTQPISAIEQADVHFASKAPAAVQAVGANNQIKQNTAPGIRWIISFGIAMIILAMFTIRFKYRRLTLAHGNI